MSPMSSIWKESVSIFEFIFLLYGGNPGEREKDDLVKSLCKCAKYKPSGKQTSNVNSGKLITYDTLLARGTDLSRITYNKLGIYGFLEHESLKVTEAMYLSKYKQRCLLTKLTLFYINATCNPLHKDLVCLIWAKACPNVARKNLGHGVDSFGLFQVLYVHYDYLNY